MGTSALYGDTVQVFVKLDICNICSRCV